MKRFFLGISLAGALLSGTLGAAALDGSWRGELNAGPVSLPIVFNFSEKDEVISCTMDSPNQNAYGLPAEVEYVSADSVALSMKSLGLTYSGRISDDVISGTFTQMGHRFPLTLKPDNPLETRRPQTPRPPFPYQEIDTLFYSFDGVPLRGTFVLPEGYERGKTPVCVFVTGSGPQNRDEEVFGHRPFAVIADWLGRNGVASFRYDDRGTAASGGDYATATEDTFKEDARGALKFAREFSGGSATGIIGHSEGGAIALLLAVEGEPDFIVSLAGPVSGKETVLAQNRKVMEDAGIQGKELENSMALVSAVFEEIIRQSEKGKVPAVDVDDMVASMGIYVPAQLIESLKKNLSATNGYFVSLLRLDAKSGLGKITCPVLALNGSLDTQVDAASNLTAIREGVKSAQVVELPGLNHLFQSAVTGDLSEYSRIPETISPTVLDLILSFLRTQ